MISYLIGTIITQKHITIMMSARRHNFLILDGLRGVAALCVLVAHASAIIMDHALLPHKYLAVQFFFMLSGFVVMCAYEQRLKSDMSFGQFALRRVIRLYPLMVVGALLGWAFFASFEPKFAADPNGMHAVATSAFGMPITGTHFNFGYFPVNPPGWSLFFELVAYFGFGLMVRWASTALLVLAAGLGLLMYGFTAVHFEGYELPFWMQIFGVCASFSIGMLLWRGYQQGLAKQYSLPFACLAAVMIGICALPERMPALINSIFVALVFPAMILLGANRRSNRLTPALEFLGELSYPLYILHWPIVLFTKHFLLPTLGPGATTVVACAVSMSVSWGIYIVFDRPFRAYLNVRLFPAPAEGTAQSA